MEADAITWIWLAGGALLMLSEVLLPGLVVVFLGAGAVMVALGRWLNLLEGAVSSFTAWFIFSLALIIVLRQFLARFIPAEISVQSTEEDLDAQGTLVEVLQPVASENSEGRIRHRGSSWPATCLEGTIPEGKKARLLYRDNLTWVVEPEMDSRLLADEEP